jgi:hypothetical protein
MRPSPTDAREEKCGRRCATMFWRWGQYQTGTQLALHRGVVHEAEAALARRVQPYERLSDSGGLSGAVVGHHTSRRNPTAASRCSRLLLTIGSLHHRDVLCTTSTPLGTRPPLGCAFIKGKEDVSALPSCVDARPSP